MTRVEKMGARAFREALPGAVRERLPEGLRDFEHRQRFSLVQIWYEEVNFHFEIWPRRQHGTVEIGLHFEHPEASRNAFMHAYFDAHMVEIWHELGEIWLEKWDRGWHKLYVTLPFPSYSTGTLAEVSERLARQIEVLEPILRLARGAARSSSGS